MAKFYKGSEVKFAINLTAQGFSMDEDDFVIEVASPRGSVKGYKTPVDNDPLDVVIFNETVQSDNPEVESTSTWYGIVDTSKLSAGDLRVIATARIVDTNANDGVRNEIAVASLGTLANP